MMQLGHYLELLRRADSGLADAFRATARAHQSEPDIHHTCPRLARECDTQVAALGPFLARYPAGDRATEPLRTPSAQFRGPRSDELGLLRDLLDLHVMVAECDACWTLVDQAAQGARETDLQAAVQRHHTETRNQLAWLRGQLAQAAVQTLVTA